MPTSKKVKVVIPVTQKKKKKSKMSKKENQEMTRLGSLLRNLGAIGGSSVGALVGHPLAGGAAGRSLGAVISRWLGSGDYQVSQNSFLPQSGSNNIPMMHKSGQSVVIRHKEYVCEVMGSTSFQRKLTLSINPGNPQLFPWLSGIAGFFEQYRIKGMVYHYVPTSGTAVSGTNPAIGSVMLQTSYRANATPPSTKVEVLNEYWSSEGAPNVEFCHPIECDPKENPFNVHYVRQGPVPDGDSELLYDLGSTHICTSGMPGANVVGDLWISYEIELLKPVIYSDTQSLNSRVATINPSNTTPFGTLYNRGMSDMELSGDGNTLYIPVRKYSYYRVTVCYTGTGFNSIVTPTWTQCSVATYGGATTARQMYSPSPGVFWMYTAVILTDASQETVTLTISTMTPTTWSTGSFVEVDYLGVNNPYS